LTAFAPSFVSLRVLVVEPDRDLSLTFDTILGHDGHTVTIASNASSAMDAASRQPYELAFVDTRIGAPAIEALGKALREAGNDTGIVLVAGLAENVDGATLHRVGGEAVLPTPFGAVELRGAVAKVYGPRYLAAIKARRDPAYDPAI
jgi:DNA-binding response OmpR family regulator